MHDGKLFLLKKVNNKIYRVGVEASSAGETGSCSSDERSFPQEDFCGRGIASRCHSQELNSHKCSGGTVTFRTKFMGGFCFMHTKRISVRTITYLALLVALEIVLNRFCSINTMGLKIGFSFVPIVVAANLFGPVPAAAVYALSDFLGAILFPIGPYHPGFTLCAALMGLTYGFFLSSKNGKTGFLNILAPVLINQLVFGLLINTIWVTMLYGDKKNYIGWFLYRLPEYAILIPVALVLIPVLLRLCRELKKYVIK